MESTGYRVRLLNNLSKRMLKNKKVVVGVSGSIAAYKAAYLVRLLKKQGAEVRVVMTPSALDFITPLTLSTLSENPVWHTFSKNESGEWNNHVELALWADCMLIAPASMNTIGKMAGGICDNLLLAVYFSAKCPVFVAPAMDLDMYRHQANITNLNTLKKFGNTVLEAAYGELASGLTGQGRMQEPEQLVAVLEDYFAGNKKLKGKKILITAGPTVEPIDPVRYISNHSTGKMGYALAEYAATLGADVTLVSGPVQIACENPAVKVVKVTSAADMYAEVKKNSKSYDVAIMAAAVADYTARTTADKKIKKKEDKFALELVKTTDISAALGKTKTARQVLVGFALETDNEEANALKKIKSKNLDFIVLNSMQDKGAGFGHDTNKITIINKSNKKTVFELKEKKDVARDIIDYLIAYKK